MVSGALGLPSLGPLGIEEEALCPPPHQRPPSAFLAPL